MFLSLGLTSLSLPSKYKFHSRDSKLKNSRPLFELRAIVCNQSKNFSIGCLLGGNSSDAYPDPQESK